MCSRVTDWIRGGGSGGGNELNRTIGDVEQMTRSPQCYPYALQGGPSPDPAKTIDSLLIGPWGQDRCALSEAFERVVTIDGDEEEARGSRGGSVVSEGIGIDDEVRGQRLGYGPSGTSHLSASKTGHAGGGLPQGDQSHLLNDGGGHVRRRRTVGKKQVRFASKVEVLQFRKDWATRSVRMEHKGRR